MKLNAYNFVKDLNLDGRTFLITGAYSGLGAIHSKALLKAGATVIIAGRNNESQIAFGNELRSEFPNLSPSQIDTNQTLDLGDLRSVQSFAKSILSKYQKIDCLVLNAGVMFTPPGKTKDGFEIQMGPNVIGHFLLAKMLVEITERQVWLSSRGHIRFGSPRIDLEAITQVDPETYQTRQRYQQAKLGNILLAKQFTKDYPHLKAVSLHPGVVKTNLGRHMSTWKKVKFVLSHPIAIMNMVEPEEGAATQVMLSVIPDEKINNGAYYIECEVAEETESARNMEDAKALFDYCERVTRDFQ